MHRMHEAASNPKHPRLMASDNLRTDQYEAREQRLLKVSGLAKVIWTLRSLENGITLLIIQKGIRNFTPSVSGIIYFMREKGYEPVSYTEKTPHIDAEDITISPYAFVEEFPFELVQGLEERRTKAYITSWGKGPRAEVEGRGLQLSYVKSYVFRKKPSPKVQYDH